MRILLDTRDLIGVLDRDEPCSLPCLRERLLEGNHVVAMTPTVVFELAAPLVRGTGQTIVSRRLNELETLPLTYLADLRVPAMEIREAVGPRRVTTWCSGPGAQDARAQELTMTVTRL